ncbi:MAG: hypothetical protein L0338_03750 [Acidobacteria bacterium]|nr:hypothetical protein [Acidobacteriota bacterium]
MGVTRTESDRLQEGRESATVWMENKPGTLAVMAEALGKAKVNILAFMTDRLH